VIPSVTAPDDTNNLSNATEFCSNVKDLGRAVRQLRLGISDSDS